MRVSAFLLCLLACAQNIFAAEQPALADIMRRARHTDGFEARMNISTIKPNGSLNVPFKLALIGQFTEHKQRLLLRGISPDTVHNRHIAAEQTDRRFKAIEYRTTDTNRAEIDIQTGLFNSGLVIWDMFSPWWNWPKQEIAGTGEIAGRPCLLIRSQTDTDKVREVISCVDREAMLSLRTQLFDRSHTLLRTLTVQQLMHKESGAMAAKKLSITEADKSVTQIEIYSGDEHYLITPETFARLDAFPASSD
jgi:hypothetical protein